MLITKKITILIFIIGFYSVSPVLAQWPGGGDANPNLHTNQESLKKWKDMRFGMFIHWGPVTLRGTEISWSRGNQVPIKDYDSLYKTFTPVLFNAAKWVKTAKQAGMKYLIITAKHHDGFCLWDSRYTDYDIMNTPYRKDIVKALAEECKKQGITFGIYYSVADWHYPDYPVDQRTVKPAYKSASKAEKKQAMAKYVSYMKAQLKELIENYNPSILWFDGEWEEPWTHKMGMDLYAYLRDLKNDLIINNRVDKRNRTKHGIQGDKSFFYTHAGDYRTPEQHVGNYNTQIPWESCITIGRQWAWKTNDKLKSTKELTSLLLNTVGGDGNLLLNVGPMMDGRIEQRQIDSLKVVGQWVNDHKEAIYGTTGGPYVPTKTMVSTRKDNKIFLHLLKNPGSTLTLPISEGIKVTGAEFVGTDKQVGLQQRNGTIEITLPAELPDDLASTIELELDQPAQQLDTIERIRY